MNKSEALIATGMGHKITHPSLGEGCFLWNDKGMLKTEKNELVNADFLADVRKSEWSTGWSIFKTDSPQEKLKNKIIEMIESLQKELDIRNRNKEIDREIGQLRSTLSAAEMKELFSQSDMGELIEKLTKMMFRVAMLN